MNTLEAAVNMLRRHNCWRRGDDTVEAVDPTLLGCAIDVVCDHIEKVPDDVKQRGVIVLRDVVRCLRENGSYSDEEGEATNALEDLLAASGEVGK
jgi:hypothetical protein